jgi:MFS transporter, Spinster family, sphingosine-1-phosphate transporter
MMRRAWALLALLTALNVLSWVDRQIVPALAPLLMADLDLSNAQVGLLYGYAFILCFILASSVLGPLADRVHRPRLVAGGLAVWSAFTAASGLARSFPQLAGARVMVGIGEATLTPAALAMLSDAFPDRWRARAAGIFAIGLPIGSGLSLVIAGLLAPRYGWRTCFYVLGAVGIVAAILTAFVPEPRAAREATPAARRRADYAALLSPAAICTIAGGVLVTFSTAASIHVITWLVRERGFEFRDAAIMAGGIYAAAGAAGNVAGGWIADWCEARWRGGRLWSLATVQAVLGIPTLLFFTSAPGSAAFYAGWVLSSLRGTIWYGPLYAATQDLAPAAQRATAIAFLMLAINLLGGGPGPWLAGAIGDRWSLTVGLIVTTSVGVLAAIPFALAARLRTAD